MELPMLPIGKSPSYLVRNRHSYCFRMNVPVDLQPFIGKKELRYSLKTGYIGVAKHKSRYLAAQIRFLFNSFREGYSALKRLTDDQIRKIVNQYIQDRIKFINGPGYIEDYQNSIPYYESKGLDPIEINELRCGELKSEAYHLSLERVEGKFEILNKPIKDVLRKNGFDNVDASSKAYKNLCNEIYKAAISLSSLELKSLQGNFSWNNDLPTLFPETFFKSQQQAETNVQTSDTVKQAAENYWNEYTGDLKPRSGIDYEGYKKQIIKFFGHDTQLHTIDWSQVKKFRDGLQSGEYSASRKPLSVGRINTHIEIFKKMYSLAQLKDRNLDRINPADGLRLKDKRRADEKQDVFSIDDLTKIFIESPEYGKDKHRNSHSFWLPILGLFTGARLEELCQLFLTDVVQRDGVWCIDVNETDAPDLKSVKSSERRIVPLHPFLVNDLQFIDYVKSIPQKDVRVFPKLVRVKHRWGHGYSQSFTKFKIKCGIVAKPRKKTFHSFRHTLINFLKQNGAREEHVKEFVGHKGHGDITWDLYGKRFEPQVLMNEVVSKLKYSLDLSHLKNSKWVLK